MLAERLSRRSGKAVTQLDISRAYNSGQKRHCNRPKGSSGHGEAPPGRGHGKVAISSEKSTKKHPKEWNFAEREHSMPVIEQYDARIVIALDESPTDGTDQGGH